MIEAMACGTPVFAFRCGSVSEVVDDGVSGFVVDDVAGAIEAVRRIGTIDRDGVRAAFERRFTVGRMARDYVALYRRLNEIGRESCRDRVGQERYNMVVGITLKKKKR